MISVSRWWQFSFNVTSMSFCWAQKNTHSRLAQANITYNLLHLHIDNTSAVATESTMDMFCTEMQQMVFKASPILFVGQMSYMMERIAKETMCPIEIVTHGRWLETILIFFECLALPGCFLLTWNWNSAANTAASVRCVILWFRSMFDLVLCYMVSVRRTSDANKREGRKGKGGKRKGKGRRGTNPLQAATTQRTQHIAVYHAHFTAPAILNNVCNVWKTPL